MSSTLLLTVVSPIAAIAMILLAVRWASRGQHEARIATRAQAIAVLASADDAFTSDDVLISLDGRTALLSDAGHPARLAVVYVVGVCLAARVLTPAEIHQVSWESSAAGDAVLSLRLWDVGCPLMQVVVPRQALATWRPRVDDLLRPARVTP